MAPWVTVILKLSLESSRETRWLAVLLGPGHEAMAAVTAAAIAPVSGPEP